MRRSPKKLSKLKRRELERNAAATAELTKILDGNGSMPGTISRERINTLAAAGNRISVDMIRAGLLTLSEANEIPKIPKIPEIQTPQKTNCRPPLYGDLGDYSIAIPNRNSRRSV